MVWKELVTVMILLTVQASITALEFKTFRFKPGTSIFSGERDGIVLVRWDNGKETTICNKNVNAQTAALICEAMGYPPKGYAIAQRSSGVSQSGRVGRISCSDNEKTLYNCYKSFKSECSDHTRDVHVFCLEKKVIDHTKKSITNCTAKENQTRLYTKYDWRKNSGLINIFHEGKYYFVCDHANQLNNYFADASCRAACSNVDNPRIIQNEIRLLPSTKFVKMKWFKNKYQVDTIIQSCPNYQVVSLECGDEVTKTEKSPNVTCTSDTMTVEWSADHSPEIDDRLVTISEGCNSPDGVNMTYNASSGLSVQIDLAQTKIIETTSKDIYFVCNLVRRYNSEIKAEKNIRVSCRLPKTGSASESLNLIVTKHVNLKYQELKIQTRMKLYTNNRFRTRLDRPYKVEGGESVYAMVSLLNPPEKMKLVMKRCYVANSTNEKTSKKVYLIQNGCPIMKLGVALYPVTKTQIGIRFQPERIKNKFPNNKLHLFCQGIKCFDPSHSGCRYCRGFLRKKRSVNELSKFEDVPSVYQTINFV